MITVLLDSNNFWTGSYAKIGSIPNGISVDTLPSDLSNYKTTCYKYDNNEWFFDEEKHKKILEEIENYIPPKTDKEKIEDLEQENEALTHRVSTLQEVNATQEETITNLQETNNSLSECIADLTDMMFGEM